MKHFVELTVKLSQTHKHDQNCNWIALLTSTYYDKKKTHEMRRYATKLH